MLTKNTFCCLLALLFMQSQLLAQDKLNFKFGKVSPGDFDVNSTLIDSSTNAVVIADVGKSEFIANASDLTFSLAFTEKKRIKIINKNGFDAATIIIPLYVNDAKVEKLDYLHAYTYNMEGGKVIETKVEKSSVFTERHSKHWLYNKFTFPALKEGSIIEYSYQVKSDFFFNLQPWTFQGEYPVLWSEYRAGIPEFFKYVTLSQGYQPFLVNKVDESLVSFAFVQHDDMGRATADGRFTVDGNIDYHTWIMKDVHALKEEAYTTTLRNSIAKIEFQLNQVWFPHSSPQNYMDTWAKVSDDLMLANEFGVPIERANNWLDKDVDAIVKNETTDGGKAQKIFEYVRDNFTCSDDGMYITTNLKDVLRNKSGSVADINMLLIAMLRNQKLDANPVILSTRAHGFAHELYPLMDRYNYVIAKVVTGGKEYYLDGTIKKLKYGSLPSKVYNGQAREITKGQAKPVYFVADSLREADVVFVNITQLDNGQVEGSFNHKLGIYESLQLREKATATTIDDLQKSTQKEYPEDIAVNDLEIDSLKLLNEPVAIKYNLKVKSFNDEDIVYFNPMLTEAIKRNPFAAADRFYPVEMPYTMDNTYNLVMNIPKGYKIDELPKSARVNFNDDEGMFEYLITANDDFIQMRCKLFFKRANFANDDYQTLRDFYSFIIKKEAEQIVFKKIK
ncbi:MAG: DUF3857 and transglutaminase domain-containing protein [Ginsengibacter sp.]